MDTAVDDEHHSDNSGDKDDSIGDTLDDIGQLIGRTAGAARGGFDLVIDVGIVTNAVVSEGWSEGGEGIET